MEPFGNPQGMLLQQLAGGYAPIVSGRPHVPMTGLEGIPGMSQPGLPGMMMQAFLAPRLQQMMGAQGFSSMGVGHDMNVYDVMRQQQFTAAQHEAMRQASEMDRGNYLKTFRGLAAMSGTPWGAQQQRAARQLADSATFMSPMMAEMMPELLDEMGGMRGSATVLAQRMMLGGRYRLDPVSGRMGMTAESAGQISRNVYQDLFAGNNLSQMQGMTAGQFGTLFDELSRRGMVEGSTPGVRQETMSVARSLDRGRLEQIAQQQGVTLPNDLNKLGGEDLEKLRLDPTFETKLRGFDTERVKRSLKSYVDVIGAMRDIFGDNGRPNAPMAELIQGLEALTQGGVGKIDTGRLNMMVRTTHELAKQSGMSMDQALMVQQHAAARAQSLGISPLHAVEATQGAMAWSSAFRSEGGSAVPAWGRMNADQMLQLDTNLRVQAAGSEQANRLAVMMRVRQRVGGFEQNSTAEAMARAIDAGATEFYDPATKKVRSTRMDGGDFSALMMGAKGQGGQNLHLDEGTLSSMLSQRFTNEEFIQEHGIGQQVRQQQAQDAREWLGVRYSESLSQRLRAAGMDEEQAERIAAKASGRIASRVGALSHGEFADAQSRTDKTAQIIQEELSAAGGKDFFKQQNIGEDFFQLSAESSYGYIDRSIQKGQMRGFESYQNLHATSNQQTNLQAIKNKVQARFQAEVADALAPLGRGTVLQRAVSYLQDAGPDADVPGLISKALGGVPNAEISAGLQKPLLNIRNIQSRLQELQEQYLRLPEGEEKTRLMEQITAQREALRAESKNLVTTAEQYGIFTEQGVSLSAEDANNTYQAFRDLSTGQQDLLGLSGDFAHQVTDAEVQAVRKGNPKLESDDEAIDLILRRRSAISLSPADHEIGTYMNQHQVDRHRAEEVLTARARALRFGISQEELTAAGESLPKDQRSEDRVAMLAIERRMNRQLMIDADDLASYRGEHPEYDALSDDDLRQRMRTERQTESGERWNQFWNSDSGGAFRAQSEDAWEGLEDFTTRMVSSKDSLRKLGPEAIESYRTIRTQQQQLRELAARYTDGDMARLLAGDLTNITDPETLQSVRKQTFDLQSGLARQSRDLRDRMGGKGARWGDDLDRSARVLLGLSTDPATRFNEKQQAELQQMIRDVAVAQRLSPEDIDKLTRFQKADQTLKSRASELGVTPDELGRYLAGGGDPSGKLSQLDPDVLAGLKETYQQQQTLFGELEKRSPEIEGSRGFSDLYGGLEAIQKLDKLGEGFREKELMYQSDLLKQVLPKVGLDVISHEDFIGTLAQQTGSETGRGFTRHIIAATEELGGLAGKLRGTLEEELKRTTDPKQREALQQRIAALTGPSALAAGELVDQYMDIRKDKGKLTEFRAKLGLESDAKFGSFATAADFYQWTGMERLDDLKPADRAERLGQILQALDQGVKYKEERHGDSPAAQQYITLDGTLKIVGDSADVNAEGRRTK
jgi:hypothetical protein